ncbi:MAG: chemotaxis protein CheA [Methanomicrobia archaeon]|nr:chemotaxis protein CheA [Methanomicrobia archaeon]
MSTDTDIDLSQYLNVFLEETKEHLQVFTQAMIDLEDADADRAAEVLNEAFRAAHTIKGMSASMGFGTMEHLCHSTEDLMDKLRSGSRSVTPEIIDVLLDCSTKLEALTSSIEENGNDAIDISAVLTELTSLLEKKEIGTEKRIKEKQGKAKKGQGKKKKADNDEDTAQRTRTTYTITVSLDKSCEFKGARGFLALNNLAALGEIVNTIPSQEDIESDNFDSDFTVLFAAEANKEDVKKVLMSVGDVEKVVISEEKEEGDSETGVQCTEKAEPGPKKVKSKDNGKEKEEAAKSVRMSIEKLDTVVNLVGELVINKSRLIQIGREHEIEELISTMAVVERTISDLQYEVTQMRMIPVEHVFNRFPKLVRDLYRAQGKEIEFIVEGREIELDRIVLDEIVDPIVHLLRNAVDHGIGLPEERERLGKSRKGRIRLVAQRETGHVAISVEDDGKGMDANTLREKAVKKGLISVEEASKLSDEDAFKLIFMSGFSTAEKTTEISGRGVGMGVVKTKVEELGGLVEIQSTSDMGTRIMLKLPLTTAIIQALLVKVYNKTYAIPLSNVREIISVPPDSIKTIHGTRVTTIRGSILPLLLLHYLFGLSDAATATNSNHNDKLVVVVVERSEGRIGLVVDAALEQQEIVVKPPDERMQGVTGLGGFTILGDGSVIPILDITTLSLA